jgi:sugar/nucleoside kinase (ribokinase family)
MTQSPTLDLIGVGNPLVDVLARVPDDFLAKVGGDKGGMILVEAEAIARWLQQIEGALVEAPGGSAGNTTFAATRLGLRTAFIGKTGNDATGAYYRNALKELGGDDSRFKIAEGPNGRCLSLITPDSQRTLRTHLGIAATLAPGEIRPEDFAGARHAHIEGYLLFNPDLMLDVLKSAKAAGCTVSVDLASFEVVQASKAILPALLKEYVDLVFANEDEAAAFCGKKDDFSKLALELATLCPVAAVKAGVQGAWIAQGSDVFHTDAVPGITAIDTTGAGDYWAAGFLSAWLKGHSFETAAQWGAILGAEVVQLIGAELPQSTWQSLDLPG